MKKCFVVLVALVTLLPLLVTGTIGCARQAPQQTPAEFYKGKTMKIIIPFSPGGGYDTWARVVAPYMAKYTGAEVLVENMEGAGGVVAYNYMYNTAPRDGLAIAITTPPSMINRERYGEEGVKYVSKEFVMLGRLTLSPSLIWVSPKGRAKTMDAIRGIKDLKSGSTGAGSESQGQNVMFLLALGMKPGVLKDVTYPGNNEIILAIMRGELDFASFSDSSGLKYAQSGDLIPLVALSKERSALLKDAPTIHEAVPSMPAEYKKVIEILSISAADMRSLFAPPSIPADRAAYLADAMAQTMKDPAFLAELEKRKFLPIYLSAADLTKALSPLLNMTKEDAAEVSKVIAQYR